MLGILTLDTAFPRIPGDVGCAATFDFPVRYATPAGADPERIVHRRDDAMLPGFVAAAKGLIDAGALGIATTCGFLARWQDALTAALDVPVLSSALLQSGLVARTLSRGKRVGVVTYSAADLTPDLLAAAGLDAATPIAGVDPSGVFARTIRHGAATLDRDAMAADVVAAARQLLAAHAGIGAIVLECANMPPYGAAVRAATGLPVYDAAQLVAWFHQGLGGSRGR
ncbi:MAG TPA: aspartate/glutamate racemase family protein [Casimicrobiaceae bacterium]|nr:aspartate/glutamate racemase family protein [Casimicrobiaceae bacterium]